MMFPRSTRRWKTTSLVVEYDAHRKKHKPFVFLELVEPEDIDVRTYRTEDRRATLAVVCQETDHRKQQRRS